MRDITFDTTPSLLLLEWPSRSNRRSGRNSAWRSFRAHGRADPPFPDSLGALIGHLISSFLVFAVLLVLTWELGFLLVWLNTHQPFSAEDLRVISKLKTWTLYFDAFLYAFVSASSVWRFLKGAFR